MEDRLACPYCGVQLQEPIPEMIEGEFRIRCPTCGSLFVFSPEFGSIPLEDGSELHVSTGRLSSRLSIGQPPASFRGPGNILSRVFFCICIGSVFIIIAIIIMSMMR